MEPGKMAVRANVEGFSAGRVLGPTAKVLPEDVRAHNRSLVLQRLYRAGLQSRADIARLTHLTRVTVSDLVAELIPEDLIIEIGKREDSRPGKPATLLDINRGGRQIVGLDLSEYSLFRGAVLDLFGQILHRVVALLSGSTGSEATAKVMALAGALVTTTTVPILGMGVGSPGVVDPAGVVLSAPSLGWTDKHLQDRLATRFGIPVTVGNDACHGAGRTQLWWGGARPDAHKVGRGVGSGLLLNGSLLFASRFAAGKIGHVVVGT